MDSTKKKRRLMMPAISNEDMCSIKKIAKLRGVSVNNLISSILNDRTELWRPKSYGGAGGFSGSMSSIDAKAKRAARHRLDSSST